MLEDDNISIINKDDKMNEETHIKIIDQVDETKVILHDTIKPDRKPKSKYIQAPAQAELIPMFFDKLNEKKKQHPNITDCWNNANMQAEKFFLHWESKGWKIEKLNLAISKWINNAIDYGQVTKPCPIHYKGNPVQSKPNTPQPQAQKPELTHQDIEASTAHLAEVGNVFAKMGVRV